MTQPANRLLCPDAEVAPGEAIRCALRVRNPTDEVVDYTVSGLGRGAGWVSTEPSSLRLMPDTEGELLVNVAVPPDPSVVVGDCSVRVRIDASSLAIVPETFDVPLRIVGMAGGTGAIDEARVRIPTDDDVAGTRRRGRWVSMLSITSVVLVVAGMGLLTAAMLPGNFMLGAIGFVSLIMGICGGFLSSLARILYRSWW